METLTGRDTRAVLEVGWALSSPVAWESFADHVLPVLSRLVPADHNLVSPGALRWDIHGPPALPRPEPRT